MQGHLFLVTQLKKVCGQGQPFLALLLAAPILGERLDPLTLGFSLVILVVVAVGRWLP
jgi:drug/metabolite transporter (DMT)-like permease